MSSFEDSEDLQYSINFTVIECMINPLRKKLKTSDVLNLKQLGELCQNLEGITHLIAANFLDCTGHVSTQHIRGDKVILSFVQDVCLPFLSSLRVFPDTSSSSSIKIKCRMTTVHSIASCFAHVQETEILCQLFYQSISSLSLISVDDLKKCSALSNFELCIHSNPSIENFEFFDSLDILSSLLDKQQVIEKLFSSVSDKDTFLKHLFHSSFNLSDLEKKLFCKSLNIVSKIFTVCSEQLCDEFLSVIWQKFSRLSPDKDLKQISDNESLWRSLYAFFLFKDFFFPLNKTKNATLLKHLGDEFWVYIQAGLVSIEPSHRKLSMYLLKRLVDTCGGHGCVANLPIKGKVIQEAGESHLYAPLFWWNKEHSSILQEIWEIFILLMETLEEKQVHVIKPVLSRMDKLVAWYSSPSYEGLFFLHPSWLTIIYTRCFQHESHFMSRWGAVSLLSLDFNTIQPVRFNQLSFLAGDLLDFLQENKLYSRYNDTELGRCSPVGEALQNFFKKLFLAMETKEKNEYLIKVLQKVLDNQWGSIPMIFLTQGLSNITPGPILRKQGLLIIRDIVQICLSSHESLAKSATQCFLVKTIINLVDLSSIEPMDFFTTIASFTRDMSVKRRTGLWVQMTSFLKVNRIISESWDDKAILRIALEYLKQGSGGDGVVATSSIVFDGCKVVGLSRMLLLFADANSLGSSSGKINSSESMQFTSSIKKWPLGVVLIEIQNILTNTRSRSYISLACLNACLAMLHRLGQELGDVSTNDQVGIFTRSCLDQCFQFVVPFVIRRLSQDLTQPQDLSEIKFYSNVLHTLGLFSTNPIQPIHDLLAFVSEVFDLVSKQHDTPPNSQLDMLCTSAMRILCKVLWIVHSNSNSVFNEAMRDVIKKKIKDMKTSFVSVPFPFSTGASFGGETFTKAQIGFSISSFLSSKWHCHTLMLQLGFISTKLTPINTTVSYFVPDLPEVVENAMEALSIGSGNSDMVVFGTLELLVRHIASNFPHLIPPLFDLAWSKVMEENKNSRFWGALGSFIPVALHSSLLGPDVDECVRNAVDKVTEHAFDLGQEKSGVIYVLVKQLCDVALQNDRNRKLAKWAIPLFLKACDFGTVHKKTEKIWLDVVAYLESFGPNHTFNQINKSMSKNDIATRIIILDWLCNLDPTVQMDCDFAIALLRALWDKYLEYAEASTYKHFNNSLCHRQKHRMVLILLLLSDFIQEEDYVEFLAKLKAGLELEVHPSVTHKLEWILMRLLIRYPTYLNVVWDYFDEFVQRRSVCLCSLFLIVSHIGTKLPIDVQADFYLKAFPTVIPWTMAQHYSTRIFAQACISRLWKQCCNPSLNHVKDKFALMAPTIEFLTNNSNASNTWFKLRDNFIMAAFDPVRDFSAEVFLKCLSVCLLGSLFCFVVFVVCIFIFINVHLQCI